VFDDLKKTQICGQPMNISHHGDAKAPRKRKGRPNPKGKPKGMAKGKPKGTAKGKPKGKPKPKGKLKLAPKKNKPKRPST
jgi:hypothetical protein